MSNRHNVFISYHHANDEYYKNEFERLFSGPYGIFETKAVSDGDIDPYNIKTETTRQKIRDEYIRNATVTVVLIGTETWKRKHVDWEISTSIRATVYNSRNGLLGILLPTRSDSALHYDAHTIPPRLYDNIACGFASIYNWSTDPSEVQNWIHRAFLRRKEVNPNNSRDSFAQNRTGVAWS